jgi:hypothetical protein
MFPLPCTTFDPQTVAVLTDAYDNAIEAQPTSAHEGIAKHIIELASKGERDPHKLYQKMRLLCPSVGLDNVLDRSADGAAAD